MAADTGWRCPTCHGARLHTRRQCCPLQPQATPARPSAEHPSLRPRAFFGDEPSTLVLTGRWLGAIVGSCIFVVCLLVASVYVVRLTFAEQRPGVALAVISISALFGATLGLGLMYVSMRAYTKVVLALLALYLLTSGVLMLAMAPALRQMNTGELAEYRAFATMLWFGLLCLLLGAALTIASVRWATARRARRRLAGWARLFAGVYGVLLGISGVAGIFALLLLVNGEAAVNDDGSVSSVVEQAIAITVVGTLAFTPGLILTYHAISSSMGESSTPFRQPVGILFVIAFVVVVVAGGLNMRAASPVAAPMPPLHVLAAALPPIVFIAMAGRGGLLRGRPVIGLSWRQVTLAAGISMGVGALLLATYVEGVASFAAVVLLLTHNGAFEFVRDTEEFFDVLGRSDDILSPNEQFVANLIVAAMVAPLVEEFGKSLGARWMFRPDTTRSQAFLLGAAAGGAFGFLEAMAYGLAVIGDDLGAWWQIMLLRGGSTSLHVLCSGCAVLGWWYWSRARRRRPALALWGTAVGLHALWNAAFSALDSRIFGLETLSDRTLEVIAYTVVAVLAAGFIAAIPLIARRLRETSAATEGTPLAAMVPWLG